MEGEREGASACERQRRAEQRDTVITIWRHGAHERALGLGRMRVMRLGIGKLLGSRKHAPS
jgi:hypothetical protein